MDLIGSINYIENRLGGRHPNQGKRKSAQKSPRSDTENAKNTPADANQPTTEYEPRLGRKLDTTA